MKKIIGFFLFLFSAINLMAQNPIEMKLSEASVIFTIGPQPAISSEFINVSQKELMKAFEKHIKSYKAKTKSSKRETIATAAEIKSISTSPVNVYCAYKEESRGKKSHAILHLI